MRLWIVNHYAYAPNHFAGTRHYSLARHLIRRGHDVTVISTSFFHKACRETRLTKGESYKREVIDGVPFHWMRTPPYQGNTFGRLWNMAVFAGRVWREQGLAHEPRPDAIIGSSPDLLAAWAAERLARRFGVPFVLEIRDLWPETLVSLGRVSRIHPLVLWMSRIERGLYHRADRILSLLPGAAEFIAQHGGAREKTVWLPNGIDLEWIPEPTPIEEKSTFTVMFAGAHGPANGLDLVLDAAEILQKNPAPMPIRIQLVGDGREKPRLMQKAQTAGLKNVEFVAPVPKQQVYEKLQQADAFLMVLENSPVFQWGISPNKLWDYMACARPVIFSVSTPYNPVEEAGAGVTAIPGDPRSLAESIRTLAAQPLAVRREMGQHAREHVLRHHSFENLAVTLEGMLHELIGEKRGDSGGNSVPALPSNSGTNEHNQRRAA
ncbi:MAG: glycosyltransferase family 4 protein [Planctomycetaceae bacterium]